VAISFAELSSHYPATQFPCGDGWENQCAIRMSIALEGAGFSLGDYSDPKCSHGHARGAESLANHLWRSLARPQIFSNPSGAKSSLLSKRGIVFFKDISGFRNGTGDHIDCWDGTATKTGEYFSYCKQVWFFGLL
jgi:hypothetical protein